VLNKIIKTYPHKSAKAKLIKLITDQKIDNLAKLGSGPKLCPTVMVRDKTKITSVFLGVPVGVGQKSFFIY
jgi:hypothetical protein